MLFPEQAQVYGVPQRRDHLSGRPRISSTLCPGPSTHMLLGAPALDVSAVGDFRRGLPAAACSNIHFPPARRNSARSPIGKPFADSHPAYGNPSKGRFENRFRLAGAVNSAVNKGHPVNRRNQRFVPDFLGSTLDPGGSVRTAGISAPNV